MLQSNIRQGGRGLLAAGICPFNTQQVTIEEHCARARAGLFDASHMGEIDVRGRDAIAFVNRLVSNDVTVGNVRTLHALITFRHVCRWLVASVPEHLMLVASTNQGLPWDNLR